MQYTANNYNGTTDTCTPNNGTATPKNGMPAQVNVEISPAPGNVFLPGYNNGTFIATGTYQGIVHPVQTNY
ncbi:MAG TPA: hypothetical protein VFG04_00630 [Planctomycetaceae bacterium]|nr:hypothetical protein [Planctomycetaceae bacterium]